MANLITNSEKSRGRSVKLSILPFEGYLQSISDPLERRVLIDECKHAIGTTSDTTIYFYRTGRRRPDILKRREIAKIIRRHSGDSSYTADNLFPVEFYE